MSSRATLGAWVLGELWLSALHFVLFLLLFYCLNAAANAKQGKREREKERERQRRREIKSEVDGGQGEHHCNLSHTLWQHVCRHFYHFRIYVVSAWAASKLRSRPLLYCPIRSDKRSLSLSVSSYQFPVLFLRSPTGTSADWQTGEVQQYLQHKLPEPAWFPKDHTPYIGDQMNCFGSIYRIELNRTEQSIGPPFGHHWATADLATEAVMLEKSIFMLVKGRTVNGDSYSVLRWITAQIQAMNSALK